MSLRSLQVLRDTDPEEYQKWLRVSSRRCGKTVTIWKIHQLLMGVPPDQIEARYREFFAAPTDEQEAQ